MRIALLALFLLTVGCNQPISSDSQSDANGLQTEDSRAPDDVGDDATALEIQRRTAENLPMARHKRGGALPGRWQAE